ncbi:YetF domain-containing protein [Pedobacter sp. UC225_61]|uniref:YetF domain-containing protein n=1 Tax=Pedobacter sp. UC225_61 TaxID=3374623 RepID=UPI0037B30C7B
MREHGVEHYKDVKLAIFEVDGNISIITGDKTLKQTHYKRKKSHKTLTVGG